ncbi:MAG: electron transfer flavoprotein subunit beta/FixA family protein [Alphaproteobacteria bacterium]|nr:electron transfer flavoprotein subunit beta/FixA family protein [Alphaproteobacteria bacterium]
MKILVPVKRVVDYNVRVRVKPDHSGVDVAHVKMSMNPFDEIAVEEAVSLKEKNIASDVIAVSIGNDKVQETIRSAIAMGADRGIHIKCEQPLDSINVAKILAEIFKKESPQLVIMGKQAIDDDCNQTGQMLAALLNLPQATFASALAVEGQKATVTREVDGGLEVISLSLPAIITTDLRLNKPRFIALPKIMQARSKPLEVIAVESLNINLAPRLQTIKVEEPEKRKAGVKVKSVDELVDKLKQEGVI